MLLCSVSTGRVAESENHDVLYILGHVMDYLTRLARVIREVRSTGCCPRR